MPSEMTSNHRPRRLLLAAALIGALTLAACGGGSPATDSSSTPSLDTQTSGSSGTEPGAAGSAATASITTSAAAPTTAATTAPPATSTTAPVNLIDLEDDLTTAILETHPNAGAGIATCPVAGRLADWQPIQCFYNAYVPAEYGPIYLSLLDHHRYVWVVGHCCGAGPNPPAYPPDLFCRDLLVPPPDTAPDFYAPDENHLDYGLAVWYWLAQGRPDRMDADHNGIPCETVYPKAEIDAFWASARQLP